MRFLKELIKYYGLYAASYLILKSTHVPKYLYCLSFCIFIMFICCIALTDSDIGIFTLIATHFVLVIWSLFNSGNIQFCGNVASLYSILVMILLREDKREYKSKGSEKNKSFK